ncbi:hypothetical protein D3C73_1068720 [compost metagenome]
MKPHKTLLSRCGKNLFSFHYQCIENIPPNLVAALVRGCRLCTFFSRPRLGPPRPCEAAPGPHFCRTAHISGRGHSTQISNPRSWCGIGISSPTSDNRIRNALNQLFLNELKTSHPNWKDDIKMRAGSQDGGDDTKIQ